MQSRGLFAPPETLPVKPGQTLCNIQNGYLEINYWLVYNQYENL